VQAVNGLAMLPSSKDDDKPVCAQLRLELRDEAPRIASNIAKLPNL
jgi:hypothetical protein